MPGSSTTPGRPGTHANAPVRVAFRFHDSVGTQNKMLSRLIWLAYVIPCQRFANTLADAHA